MTPTNLIERPLLTIDTTLQSTEVLHLRYRIKMPACPRMSPNLYFSMGNVDMVDNGDETVASGEDIAISWLLWG